MTHPHFYMVRHGESEANALGQATGWLDAALTDTGLAQARACRDLVAAKAIKPKIIIHSRLQRARVTAEIINEVLELPMIEAEALNEQHFGDWQGRRWEEIGVPREDLSRTPPNGESPEDFTARIWQALTDGWAGHPAPIMFVGHGGNFRALGLRFGLTLRNIANCALYEFKPVNGNISGLPWDMVNHSA